MLRLYINASDSVVSNQYERNSTASISFHQGFAWGSVLYPYVSSFTSLHWAQKSPNHRFNIMLMTIYNAGFCSKFLKHIFEIETGDGSFAARVSANMLPLDQSTTEFSRIVNMKIASTITGEQWVEIHNPCRSPWNACCSTMNTWNTRYWEYMSILHSNCIRWYERIWSHQDITR